MANPLNNEDEIYAKLKKETIKLHPLVWELIEHHVSNDVNAIQYIAGAYVACDNPEDIPAADGKKILTRCDGVRKFLNKLRECTK